MTVCVHFQEVSQQTLLELKAFQELGHVLFMKMQVCLTQLDANSYT